MLKLANFFRLTKFSQIIDLFPLTIFTFLSHTEYVKRESIVFIITGFLSINEIRLIFRIFWINEINEFF